MATITPSFISYKDFYSNWETKCGDRIYQVQQLMEKYVVFKEQIEHIRMKIELISYFTPIGALGMFCEDASHIFFKPKYYMPALRAEFSELNEVGKNVVLKMSLSSAIDASLRKKELCLKQIKLRGNAASILAKMVNLVPELKETTHEIVIHPSNQTTPSKRKFYKKFFCEFCSASYEYESGLYKHLQTKHPNRFEESMLKYYALANKCCDPHVLAAMDLLKSDCLGMEIYEVLLDNRLSETITNIINNMGHSSEADDVTFLEEFIGSDDVDSDDVKFDVDSDIGETDVDSENGESDVVLSDIDSDVGEIDDESNLNPIDVDDLDVAGPSGENASTRPPSRANFSNIQHHLVAAAEMYEKTKHHNLNKNQQAQAAATAQAATDGQTSHEDLFMALMRKNYRQISEDKSASGFGGGGVPLTDRWNPPIMPVRVQNINYRQPFLNNESKSKQQQELHLSETNYSKAASGSGVIVCPSERIDRDSMRPDHREQLQRSFELQQQVQRLEARDQCLPTVSYKPYEQMPQLVTGSNNIGGINNNSGGVGGGGNNIRTSRSPHPQMTHLTSSSTAYPIYYAGPGPGSSQHSYSPNPTSGRSGPSNSYMPPPSFFPSWIDPYNTFSQLAHQLPQPLLNTGANNRGGLVPVSPMPMQQPLNFGTYSEDSPIPLISSARLSNGEAQSKKTRPEPQQQQHQLVMSMFEGGGSSSQAQLSHINSAAARSTAQSQYNYPGPMLISSKKTLVLKASSYGSIGQGIHGSIDTKSAYQQQPTGHQRSQMYNPYDPNQPLMNMSQVSQIGGQSYLSEQLQLLSQHRTAPPTQVHEIQPPPSSFYLEDAGQSNQNDRNYGQQPGSPSLQQMEQGSPAATGPFSLPGFASQAGLQGYANRAAQQQQQQQPQQQQQQKPSQQQQQHMEDIVQQKQGGSGTAHKSRNKVWQHQAANQQQQQLQLQQQIHPMNKFTGSSYSSGAYPGPPSLRISYVSFRSAPPPQQISGNNSNNMMSFSGSTGNNAPRYPTPIQRPTAPTGNMQQRQPPPIHSSGRTGAPDGSGLGKSSQHKCVELNFLEDDGMDEDDFKQLSFEDVIHQGFLDYLEFKTKKKDHGRYVLYCTSNEKDLFQLGINSGENFQTYDKIALQVTGKNLPQYIMSFEDTGLCSLLLSNIKKAGFIKPTPVQKGAISVILAKRDLIACTVTGSGKTAAYLVPVINILLEQCVIPFHGMVQKPEVLIVAPTRELAIRIHLEACKFAYNSALESVIICGGTVNSLQLFKLQAGCNILVATVGHLMDFLDRGVFDFSCIQFLILEDTDRILDMGFGPDIEKIATHPTMPPNGVRCTCMFSATFPKEVQALAAGYMEDYIYLTTSVCGTNMDVKQTFFQCARNEKIFKMMEIMYEDFKGKKAIVYVESQVTADYVAAILCSNSIQATSIHHGYLQSQRETALREFNLGVLKVVVVTNLTARSLDISGFEFVVNYDLPVDLEEYVHRVGRTGRVGNLGRLISLFDDEKDAPNADKLVSFLIKSNADVPAFLQAMVSGVGGMGYDFNAISEGGGVFASRDMRRFGDKPGGPARPTEAE